MNGPSLRVAFVLASILVALPRAQAVQPPDRAGKYLLTEQVTIAEGAAPSYPGLVARLLAAADEARADTWWIAADNMTGDLRRVTNLSFYDSFASFERNVRASRGIAATAARRNDGLATGSDPILARHSSLAVLREDLSFQPDKVPPSAAKYWSVTTMFLKAGHMSDFAERTKLEIDLLKRAGLDHHFLVYQVTVGVPSSGSVFYVMTPMRALAEMDADDSSNAAAAAVFTPEVRKRFETMNQQMISGVESDLLMVRPDLSRPPASYVAANPGFWTAPRDTRR